RHCPPPHLHSFPTRRSSDLAVPGEHIPARVARQQLFKRSHDMRHQHERSADAVVILVTHEAADRIEETPYLALGVVETPGTRPRSEEHTSELQSRGHLVCRL